MRNKPVIITVKDALRTTEYNVENTDKTSILELLRENGYSIPAPCGGRGTCGKCKVIVSGSVRSFISNETVTLKDEEILACRFMPAGDIKVTVKEEKGITTAVDSPENITPEGTGLGLAVDIGTTTVAAFLYDLETGSRLGALGKRNAQSVFGADVISRITAFEEGKGKELTEVIRKQIGEIAEELCTSAGRNINEITKMVVAGNTVMQHIFAGISPVGIGKAPFKPVTLFGDELNSKEMLPEMSGLSSVYLAPCISGYVGGDITCGLLATDALKEEGLRLFMDLGTNGEMALGNKEGYLTCSTATGPVFEGAEISCGMEAAEGAIDKVWAEKGDIKARVIGEVKPSGLCGSGLIDAVSVLLELGIVKLTGEIVPESELPATCRADYRIFTLKDGKRAVRIMGDVYISAVDIEKVQLAKAAVRAGVETLLSETGKSVKDISSVVIAGGFGNAINIESAVKIDLIPDIKRKVIWSAGNAAGYGAVLALNESRRDELKKIAEKCGYIELSESEVFKENYVRNMAF
jgi:uncharacterized 2Fe-2S/4Fe-4S cluster protein (DUF4445 family)